MFSFNLNASLLQAEEVTQKRADFMAAWNTLLYAKDEREYEIHYLPISIVINGLNVSMYNYPILNGLCK
jgi:hypothetical protein